MLSTVRLQHKQPATHYRALLPTEELACVSPPRDQSSEVDFAVTLNGVDLIQQGPTTFLYLSNAKTVAMEPSGGPFTGGTIVTATGIDFDTSLVTGCKFGSAYSDGIVYISDQMIQCRTPSHPPGTVDFSIMTGYKEIAPGDVVFEYYKPPTILFASPSSGPRYGETVVRIYGNDFRSNVDYLCYFGDTKVPGQFLAQDAIECSSPRIHPDNDQTDVNLLVAEKNTNSTFGPLRFSYVLPPSLEYLSPRHVLFDRGNIISVFGSHLNTTSNAWCRFTLPSKTNESYYYNTVQASSAFRDSHVECEIPNVETLSNMQVDAFVEVSTNGWDWSASRLSFVYAPEPVMHSIYPSLGSVNGNTIVTLHGTGFLQETNLWCEFGIAGSVQVE